MKGYLAVISVSWVVALTPTALAATPERDALPATLDWSTLRTLLLQYNASVEVARQGVASAESDFWWAEASPNPNVSASVAVFAAGRDEFQKAQPIIGVSQPIRVLKKAPARRSLVEAQVQLAQAEVAGVELELLSEARHRFADLALTQAQRRERERVVASAEELRGRVEARQRQGAASPFDLRKMDRELAVARSELAAANLDVARASDALGVLVGVAGWRPQASFESLAAALGAESGLHPDVLQANARDAVATEGKRVAERERWPDLVVSAGAQMTADPFGIAPYVAVSFDLMVFDKGRDAIERAKVESQRAALARAWATDQVAARRAGLETRLEVSRAALAEWDAALGQSAPTELADQARAAYAAGRADLLDVLDTVRNECDARIRRAELVGAVVHAEIDLLALIRGAL